MVLWQFSRRGITVMGLCAFTITLTAYSSLYLDLDPLVPVSLLTTTFPSSQNPIKQALHPLVSSHRTVAVINTSRESHKEVHGMILWILTRFPGLNVRFYRYTELDQPESGDEGYLLGFSKLLAPFWASANDHHVHDFVDDLRRDDSIQHIIMTTCEWDFSILEDDFEEIWNARSDEKKINVVCIQHWAQEPHALMKFLASKERLGVGLLGDHVVSNYESARQDLGYPPVERLVPVFPLDPHRLHLVDESQADLESHSIDSAVIQSRWWHGARDMDKLYNDLLDYLEEDSEAWGYTLTDEVYYPISNRPDRFILHLAGTDPAPYPPELQYLVQLHVRLSNPDFFALLAGVDVLLPAFAGDLYVTEKASSSIGVAASVRTPILADKQMADAYGYFCPASAIIRPEGTSSIDYIAMVRRGELPWKSRRESRRGIERCQEEWTAQNMRAMARLMGLQIDN